MSEKGIKGPRSARDKGAQEPMGGGDVIPLRRRADIIPLKGRKKRVSEERDSTPEPVDESGALRRVVEITKRVGDVQNEAFVTVSDALASDSSAFEALAALRDWRVEGKPEEQQKLLRLVRSALGGTIKDVRALLPWKKSEKREIAYETDVVSIKSEQGKTKDIDLVKGTYFDLRKKLEKIDDPDEYAETWNALTEEQQMGVIALQDNVQLHYDYRLLSRIADARALKEARKQTESDKRRERQKQEHEKNKAAFLARPLTLDFPGEGGLRFEEIARDGKRGAFQRLWKVVEMFGQSPKLAHEVSIALHSGNTYLSDLSNAPQWLRDAAKEKGLI